MNSIDMFAIVKRIVAISFLSVFLLNVFGYYAIFMSVRNQMAGEMRVNLSESNYAISDEITFKVPLAIPYAVDMNEFEHVDGEFKHQGTIYRLVKQKLLKDTLYIVCVKDFKVQKIDKALEDYVKTFSDKPSTEKNGSKSLNVFSKDFINQAVVLESNHIGWESIYSPSPVYSGKIISFSPDIIQPPKI